MKRGMPSGAQTPDGIIFLLALIFSKAPPRYPPHHGAHWAYTGYGGKARLKAMLRALIQEYKNGNTVIDIIGFSRGAALAREFANMINEGSFFTGNYQHEWNRYGRLFTRRVFQKCPEVRFLGIFDTVASFGMPGNDVNVGYNMKIPDNVYFTAHAVALNEYRKCFPMSSIFGIAEPILGNKRKKEQGFPGAHSDIGGGYTTREQGAYLPLLWMWQEGNRVAREKGGDPNPMFGPLPKEITDFLDNVPENNRRFYLHDSRFGDNGEFQVQYYYDLSRTSRDIYFY